MKLDIDKSLSFVGRYPWFFVIGATALQILTIAALFRGFFINTVTETVLLPAFIQLITIVFFGIGLYAHKIHMIDKAGGPEVYFAQEIDLSSFLFYMEIVDNCGVREEFDAWLKTCEGPITIGAFDQALIEVITDAYSLPPQKEISDIRFLKLASLRHLLRSLFKYLSFGCLLFAGLAIVLLFNPENTLKEGYPFIVLPLFFSILFLSLSKIFGAKAETMIMEQPIVAEHIDSLMKLATSYNLHNEFCQLLRSPARPKTNKAAHEWLTEMSSRTDAFLG